MKMRYKGYDVELSVMEFKELFAEKTASMIAHKRRKDNVAKIIEYAQQQDEFKSLSILCKEAVGCHSSNLMRKVRKSLSKLVKARIMEVNGASKRPKYRRRQTFVEKLAKNNQ